MNKSLRALFDMPERELKKGEAFRASKKDADYLEEFGFAEPAARSKKAAAKAENE